MIKSFYTSRDTLEPFATIADGTTTITFVGSYLDKMDQQRFLEWLLSVIEANCDDHIRCDRNFDEEIPGREL